MSFNKSDIETILNSPSQVSRAIEILGNNQRQDELASRSTNHQNGIGFTSCWASSGTHLWQFVTGYDGRTGTNKWGRKCLSHPNWKRAKIIRRKVYNNGCESAVELGRKIAIHHWRQLAEMLPEQKVLPPQQPERMPAAEDVLEAILVPADKADQARMILKLAGLI